MLSFDDINVCGQPVNNEGITYRQFRAEVLEETRDHWRMPSYGIVSRPSMSILRKGIRAFRAHLVWHGPDYIETARYPARHIYRALGLSSTFTLNLSRRDRWLRRWMYFISPHTVMRHARHWLAMARTFEGREFILHQRVPEGVIRRSIHYGRSLDFILMKYGGFTSVAAMDRFSMIHFDWILAAQHLGINEPAAMLKWIPGPPHKDAGEMMWILVQHGVIISPDERDWVTSYARPHYHSNRDLDGKLIGQIVDTLRQYGVAREHIAKALCTHPHHLLEPEALDRTLRLLTEHGIGDTSLLLDGLDTCLSTVSLERWLFLLDVLGVRDPEILVGFRRLLETDRPYSVELAVALAARCNNVSEMIQFQELLLAAGSASERSTPVAALELLMSAPHCVPLHQITQSKKYLCEVGRLGDYLEVLERYGFGHADAVLSFQACYGQVSPESLSRIIALAQPLKGGDAVNAVVDWVAHAGSTGYLDAYEYLARCLSVRTISQLRQVAKLAFLGIPFLEHVIGERKLTTRKALMDWFYHRAFGIKSLGRWRVVDRIDRLLLDDAIDRGAFNFLDANRACVEAAVQARVFARIGSFRLKDTEDERAKHRATFELEREAQRGALLPVLSPMLQATSGILFRSVVDRGWDGPAAFELQLSQLTPLLDELLAGRGPVEPTLTQLEAEAIGLVYRTSPDTVVSRWSNIVDRQKDIADWGLASGYEMTWQTASSTLKWPLDKEGFEVVGRAAELAEKVRRLWTDDMPRVAEVLLAHQPNEAAPTLANVMPSLGVLLAIAADEPGIATWLQSAPALSIVKDESDYGRILQTHALFDIRLPDALDAHAENFCQRLPEQSALLLARCLDAATHESGDPKRVLQVALGQSRQRVREVFGAWITQEKDKFGTNDVGSHGATLRAVVTKYPAAFFAKEAAKLCTAANVAMWQEERHAHLVVYDQVHKSLQGMALLYREVLPSLHKSRPVLVIRAINPTDDAMADYDVSSMVDTFFSTAVQIACDSGCAAVLFPANTGMHLLSNLDLIAKNVHARYAHPQSVLIGHLMLDGQPHWYRPAKHVEAAFDAYERGANRTDSLFLLWQGWPSPTMTDTFDRYDVPIGGITWHVKDGCSQKSLSAKQSSW